MLIRGVVVNKSTTAVAGVWLEGMIIDGPNGKVLGRGRADVGALDAGASRKFELVVSNLADLREIWYQVVVHWAATP